MKKLLLNCCLAALFTLGFIGTTYAQNAYNMCSMGTSYTSTDSSSDFYDSGGPGGVYQTYEDCSLLIAPPGAAAITMTFSAFNTESCCDPFYIYDGQSTASPLLLQTQGTVVPGPVTSTGGYMLIVWHSDLSVTPDGWAAHWSACFPGIITANFGLSTSNPPLNAGVNFTDQSSGSPQVWAWDFGDGGTSTVQNPTHSYSTSGSFTISMTASGCGASDTYTQSVTVQSAPLADLSNDTLIAASVQCGDSMVFTITINNTGTGDLVYSTDGSVSANVNMIAENYGVDQTYYYNRTITAINTFFTGYTVTTSTTSNPAQLSLDLMGKNVCLFPKLSQQSPAVFATYASVLNNFMTGGGTVIFCGSDNGYDNCIQSGCFTGTFAQQVISNTVNINTATHQVGDTDAIVAGIPLSTTSFLSPSATYSMNFTNSDKVQLCNYANSDVVAYRTVGSGRAIYVGFDNFNTTPETQHIIADAVRTSGILVRPTWASCNPNTDTISSGGSTVITVVFHANGIAAGTYTGIIGVATNDPLHPVIPVYCEMTVIGDPIIGLSAQCANFGTIINNTYATDTVQIINTGCDSLVVSSIVANNPAYTLTPANAILIPGQSMPVIITFHPTSVGIYNSTISVFNNAGDTIICLTGTSGPEPVWNSVASVNQSVPACGNTGTTTFTITNSGVTGAADLSYSISNVPLWMNITNATGTVPQGQSVTVTCTFNSGTFAGGAQVANLNYVSNDPLHLNGLITVTMDVQFNPCFSWTATLSTCTGIGTFTTANIINTPTSWLWDFGDGGTSTDQNPLHQYALPGTYIVTAMGINAAGTDTVINTINLTVITGPTPATCLPATNAYCCGVGLTHVGFGNINKSSTIHGYQNFTCTDTTTLVECTGYPFSATTGTVYEENLKAYIDYNNDGAFDPDLELVFVDTMIFTNHSGTINIPCSVPFHYPTPLRLRIGSDYSGNPSPNGCSNLEYGAYWDFVLFIQLGVGENELQREVGFGVYPNPFKNETKIEYSLNTSEKVSVEVFNLVGAKVAAFANDELQTIGKHSYNFTDADAGVYFVKLTVGDRSFTQKIVSMQ